MNQSLEKKLALVTGASRGIGAAIAKRLAEYGAAIICWQWVRIRCSIRPEWDIAVASAARVIKILAYGESVIIFAVFFLGLYLIGALRSLTFISIYIQVGAIAYNKKYSCFVSVT